MQHFMVSTVSAACACRCIAAVSCALPVVPGAIWRKRVRSGVRSSSARRLCSGLQATGSASPTAASRRRGCPGSQQQPAPPDRSLNTTCACPSTPRPRPASRCLPGCATRQPRRRVPAAARHFPRTGAAAGRWLCGAGYLAAYRTGLAWRPRGLSAHAAGWKRGQPLRACCWHCRAGPQGEAA